MFHDIVLFDRSIEVTPACFHPEPQTLPRLLRRPPDWEQIVLSFGFTQELRKASVPIWSSAIDAVDSGIAGEDVFFLLAHSVAVNQDLVDILLRSKVKVLSVRRASMGLPKGALSPLGMVLATADVSEVSHFLPPFRVLQMALWYFQSAD